MPQAVIAGVKIDEYWELTFGEINMYIDAYNQKKEEELKQQLTVAHAQADLIGASVARLMDKNAKYPSLFDAFPGIFAKEKQQYDELMAEQAWKVQMARLMEYSQFHNNKRKAKEGEEN